MQTLFAWEYNHGKKGVVKSDQEIIDPENLKKVDEIVASVDKIDRLIERAAPQRPILQINKIDLAILRLAIFELIMKKEVPPKVVIDEAIELAKEFGSDSSPLLVNGALGKIMEEYGSK